MRKLLFLTAAFLLLTGLAFGQSSIKPVIYAGGGISMPLSPSTFSDYWKMGLGGGGGIGIQINPNLELIGKVFYTTFGLDADKIIKEAGATGASIDGGDFNVVEFGLDIKYIFASSNPEAKFKPFIIAGLGMGSWKFTAATVSGGGSSITLPFSAINETDFALSGGAGFDMMFSPKMGVWLDVRYTMLMMEGESTGYAPIRAGLKMILGS